MSRLDDERKDALTRRVAELREMDRWHEFQNFVLGLLPHDGYTHVRLSVVRNDLGYDGLAVDRNGTLCFVAVSFDCSLPKIRKDAKRFLGVGGHEPAEVMLFITWDAPTNKKIGEWKTKLQDECGIKLEILHNETIEQIATRGDVWRETCSRLSMPGNRLGYLRVSPYNSEVIRRGLRARPPEWLKQRIPLSEWEQLTREVETRLILGKPGCGKTTTIFEQLERARPDNVLIVEGNLAEPIQYEDLLDQAVDGGVIVFDDVHEVPQKFTEVCQCLRARLGDALEETARAHCGITLLVAARSHEWSQIEGKLPCTLLHDLGLRNDTELTIGKMDEEQCASFIRLCRDEWNLVIDDRILNVAARESAKREGTPLYVISMLAGARKAEDRTLKDEHLAGMPDDVLGWWRGYWSSLDATRQGVLRLVKLFMRTSTEAQSQLLNAAGGVFGISQPEVEKALDALERALWIARSAGVPTCLDAQLEAIQLTPGTYETWDRFVHGLGGTGQIIVQLHLGTNVHYSEERMARADTADERARAIRSATKHLDAVVQRLSRAQQPALYATCLNNLSNNYSELAGLETTLEARREWLTKAVTAIEEAVRIRRELGLHADLAGSLNNASNRYTELADLETTREARREWLSKAVEAIEESVGLYRELGLHAGLAGSLNNASLRYSEAAGLETTREARREWLTKAVAAIEEAVRIRRDLGLHANLATSLNNASLRHSDLAGLETTREARREWLIKAVAAIEEAVRLYRDLGLHAGLATSLNNASGFYSDLAGLETRREARREWLTKAVAAIEEAVRIRRDLGLHADLSGSLNNASAHYGSLAGLESTREAQQAWLAKAIESIEESVRVRRGLGLPGDLGISLATSSLRYRDVAEVSDDPEEVVKLLTWSLECITEAVDLFRNVGNAQFLLMGLRDRIIAHLLLGEATHELPDPQDLLALCDEGLALAESMQDEEELDFFRRTKQMLTQGA